MIRCGGSATFCVGRNGLKAQMRLGNVASGNAYIVSWVHFDDPASCAVPHECNIPDFFGEDPQAVLGRMSSGVARPSGRIQFTGKVPGMLPSPGSQVWLFTFGHGPATEGHGKRLARQLLTPEDPGLSMPHLGNSVDGQLGYPVALNIFVIESSRFPGGDRRTDRPQATILNWESGEDRIDAEESG